MEAPIIIPSATVQESDSVTKFGGVKVMLRQYRREVRGPKRTVEIIRRKGLYRHHVERMALPFGILLSGLRS
jgi:hypothetical protein